MEETADGPSKYTRGGGTQWCQSPADGKNGTCKRYTQSKVLSPKHLTYWDSFRSCQVVYTPFLQPGGAISPIWIYSISLGSCSKPQKPFTPQSKARFSFRFSPHQRLLSATRSLQIRFPQTLSFWAYTPPLPQLSLHLAHSPPATPLFLFRISLPTLLLHGQQRSCPLQYNWTLSIKKKTKTQTTPLLTMLKHAGRSGRHRQEAAGYFDWWQGPDTSIIGTPTVGHNASFGV